MFIRSSLTAVIVMASLTFVATAPAAAQTPTQTPEVHPYGLDPYAPSDAMWLRSYGAALVAQTPMLELAALDPYKPSNAALIRQVGGAIPICCLDWFWPGPVLAPMMPGVRAGVPPAAGFAFFSGRGADTPFIAALPPPRYLGSPADTAAANVPAVPPGPTAVATLNPPRNNDGVSIQYDGRTWVSAGRAVPLVSSAFQQVGQYAGAPVYRRTTTTEDVVYIPTRDNLVAPFRLKP
jgi:hypothetical protein